MLGTRQFLGEGETQTCDPVSPSPPQGLRPVTVESLDELSGELSRLKTSSSQLPAPSRHHPSLLSPQSFLQTMVKCVQASPRIDSGHWGLVMHITAPEGTVLGHKAGRPVLSPGGLVDSRWPQPLQEKSRCLREGARAVSRGWCAGALGSPALRLPGGWLSGAALGGQEAALKPSSAKLCPR